MQRAWTDLFILASGHSASLHLIVVHVKRAFLLVSASGDACCEFAVSVFVYSFAL